MIYKQRFLYIEYYPEDVMAIEKGLTLTFSCPPHRLPLCDFLVIVDCLERLGKLDVNFMYRPDQEPANTLGQGDATVERIFQKMLQAFFPNTYQSWSSDGPGWGRAPGTMYLNIRRVEPATPAS